jgi:hypothetical protein
LIVGSGIAILANAALGPYTLAGATVLLIIIGIRNAWDIVVWMSTKSQERGS